MDEAEKIYKAIFKEKIPPVIRERYYDALEKFSSGFTEREKEEFKFALSKISDLEALEFAARLRNALPLLVFRFRLMVYLAESIPENSKFYLNLEGREFAWPFILKIGLLRSLLKLIKGIFLLRKVENV